MAPSLEAFARPANPEPRRASRAAVLATAAALLLPGCGLLESAGNAVGGGGQPQAGQQGFVRGFLGGVAAEEPRAALAARNVLSAGGSAVDAAVAAGFMMTASLPSRAGLGGGGACLVFNPRRNEAEAVLFPPGGREAVPPRADRPAALPMMARGLFALHSRGGRRPFEELVAPAEGAARLGLEVSRALATDLAAVAGPLLADPWAAAVFAGPNGQPLATGERLLQPDLGGTLGALRTAGVGDLHQGQLARRLEEASTPAGGGLTAAEMRAALPRLAPPLAFRAGQDTLSFLPVPADGGLAAAAAFAALQSGAAPDAAAARGVAVARAWRERGGDPAALVTAEVPADAAWPVLPASAGLAVVDRDGMAVSCAFTMNNLFGTGRVAPGTGILLAAAPGIGQVAPPLLSAGIAHNANLRSFRAAAAGSGQHMAPLAVALPLFGALRGADAPAAVAAVPDPGRAQLLSCPGYLPGANSSCTGATDPRGAGLALGAVDR
ncbi:gamma-glutamyltransferase [Falsiroseomonas sp. CW058]|uniref:gamma-glutamyltransferase n=1 Tax=Falsiroseomonas sp. CW058 TaxID=3388664 RepID=UPI003D321719